MSGGTASELIGMDFCDTGIGSFFALPESCCDAAPNGLVLARPDRKARARPLVRKANADEPRQPPPAATVKNDISHQIHRG